MSGRPCAICKAKDAPFGFRRSGAYSRLAKDKRGYLVACARPDCQLECFNRRETAENRKRLTMAEAYALHLQGRPPITFPADFAPPAAIPTTSAPTPAAAKKAAPSDEIGGLFGSAL